VNQKEFFAVVKTTWLRISSTASKAAGLALSTAKNIYSNISNRKSLTSLDLNLLQNLHGRKTPTWSQFKHLPRVLSAQEKKVLKTLSISLILGGLLYLYGFFFVGGVQRPTVGGSYTEGLIGNALYINPLLAQSNDVDADLVRLVYNGLVRYDNNYQPIPDLAKSWTISEDGKTYTFKIRDDIYWHDGKPLTANDVLFTFQTIQNKDFKSPLNITFQGVEISITGENTITFTLPEPYAGFIHNLTVEIIPQHLWIDVSPENFQLSPLNQKPIGTGAFAYQSATPEKNGTISAITLTANKKYHLGRPNLETLSFKMYPDTLSALEALKNKNVQGISYLPKDYLTLANKRNIALKTITSSQFTAVFFNPNTQPLFKDATVRKALELATNKVRLLNEVLLDQGIVIHSAILPGYPGYDESIKDQYDPIKAAETLTADGWAVKPVTTKSLNPAGEEVESTEDILVKKDTPLKITITTIDQPDSVKLVKYLKDDWSQIGVSVEIRLIDRTTFVKSTLKNRDYESLAYGGLVGYDSDPFYFWHSSQREYPGVNLAGYVNRKVDTIIEDARRMQSKEDRAKAYGQVAQLIADDEPAIFLYSPTYSYPVSTEIKGVEINRLNLPSDRFWNVQDWYIKTKRSRK